MNFKQFKEETQKYILTDRNKVAIKRNGELRTTVAISAKKAMSNFIGSILYSDKSATDNHIINNPNDYIAMPYSEWLDAHKKTDAKLPVVPPKPHQSELFNTRRWHD